MQALMVVGTLMQVVGSISAGEAQASALNQQAEMYMKQASLYNTQIELEQVENDRRVAQEKSATAQESLMRTQKLQRIIGATVAKGAAAGIGTQYGTITRLNEESMYEASVEEAIADDNSQNRIISLNLNSAINQQNLSQQAYGSVFNANQMYASAGQARMQGYMNAASSLMSFGMNTANRGSAPTVGTYNTSTGSAGMDFSIMPGSGEVIRWN